MINKFISVCCLRLLYFSATVGALYHQENCVSIITKGHKGASVIQIMFITEATAGKHHLKTREDFMSKNQK